MSQPAPAAPPLADAPCFIETQFPVAKISMESYKERTAKPEPNPDRPGQVVGPQAVDPGARRAAGAAAARVG